MDIAEKKDNVIVNDAARGKYASSKELDQVIIDCSGSQNVIGESAFTNSEVRTAVIINCSKIMASAFANCEKLEQVVIFGNLQEIGAKAFMNCKSLTEIYIPASVETIGNSAFENCELLSHVAFEYESSSLKAIGSKAFKACKSLQMIKLPDSLRAIGNYAFSDGYALEIVDFSKLHITFDGEAGYCNVGKAILENTNAVAEHYYYKNGRGINGIKYNSNGGHAKLKQLYSEPKESDLKAFGSSIKGFFNRVPKTEFDDDFDDPATVSYFDGADANQNLVHRDMDIDIK